MNYNILAYIIYLIVIVAVIFWVGKKLHTLGRVYILNLFKNDVKACDSLNNVLLVAYYLFNIGYAFLKLRNWRYVRDVQQLIYSISYNIGLLLMILAFTHYFNVALIYRLSKNRKLFLHIKYNTMKNQLAVLAYIIYLPTALILTWYVAKILFKNSIVYMKDIFPAREDVALATNSLFRIGFYLLNIGFALFILRINYVNDAQSTIEALSYKIGGFSVYLGAMLFLNMYLFFRGRKVAKQSLIKNM